MKESGDLRKRLISLIKRLRNFL